MRDLGRVGGAPHALVRAVAGDDEHRGAVGKESRRVVAVRPQRLLDERPSREHDERDARRRRQRLEDPEPDERLACARRQHDASAPVCGALGPTVAAVVVAAAAIAEAAHGRGDSVPLMRFRGGRHVRTIGPAGRRRTPRRAARRGRSFLKKAGGAGRMRGSRGRRGRERKGEIRHVDARLAQDRAALRRRRQQSKRAFSAPRQPQSRRPRGDVSEAPCERHPQGPPWTLSPPFPGGSPTQPRASRGLRPAA
mmetsp:Transcript_29403/g.103652  ORF Transcript_29403/g.103652 Transcript_29403/m.103652 type:complete len:252 (+) Transcript_29403:1598-2353(+)